jgi:opacity protein-like surface antigen
MNTKHIATLGLIALLSFAGSELRAQTAATPPPMVPATSSAPGIWQADLIANYVPKWFTGGLVGDVGVNWMNNFVGVEVSWYDANPQPYSFYTTTTTPSYWLPVTYRMQVVTENIAYRYSFPVPISFSLDGNPAPISIYAGGSFGVGQATYYPNFSGYIPAPNGPPAATLISNFQGLPGYNGKTGNHFDYTVVAGVKIALSDAWSFGVGYRWISLPSVTLFYNKVNLGAGAFDGTIGFKF